MSKVSRRLALILAIVLAFSLALTACGPKEEAKTPDDGEAVAYKLGVNTWGSGVPILDSFGDAAQYTAETMGCTVIRASDDFTSDKELTNAQNFIAAGVDGILLQAAAPTTLPEIARYCKDAKVPFVLHVFIGDDPDRDKVAAENEYYVGAIDSDMVTDGKLMAEAALRDGCKTAVLIGGNIGDNNMDQRSQGFTDAFVAGGGTVLSEARCTDASEAPTKAEDMLSANMDADCLYAMVGDYIPGSISAIENLGLSDSIKVYMSCVDKTSAAYIKEGKIVEGNDGITLASYIAPMLMLNYLDGHKIVDANGDAPRFQTTPFSVNKDNVDGYLSVFDGTHPFTAEMINDLCWRHNPEVTYQTYVDLLSNLSLDYILKAHGK